MTPALVCRGVGVERGGRRVIDALDLQMHPDETLAVLGPSGSGKSTLLYAIAGFLDVASGAIEIDGEVVSTARSTVPPERRQVGVVFQNYALWPHMSAEETVAYPLRRAGVARRDALRRAGVLLETLGIRSLADRRPDALSGGEQQRVGLARALARDARLYLFDEPTAHLDAAVRSAVQEEIGRRRREIGSAAIYATHDAGEALALADRVALLRDGRIVQLGSSKEVYEQPVDRWAAELTGLVSIVEVDVVESSSDRALVSIGEDRVTTACRRTVSGRTRMLVRPEWVRLSGINTARVAEVWFRGPHTDYRLAAACGTIDARLPGPPIVAPGDETTWSLERGWIPDSSAEP